ncbi:hypothetical protein [Pseudomonas sp.]|uniref:hypothetical protein n=1 Tax=Pseudomonas sp. TaxID=306 RepID=UPI002579FB51|nr:hypothetical protein [Pseudomonas sp.]
MPNLLRSLGLPLMPGRLFTQKLLRALSLAFLTVWLWQTSALLTGIEAPVSLHSGAAKGAVTLSCMLCTAENQASATADHAHEPPSLVSGLLLPAQPGTALPDSKRVVGEPLRRVYHIERPPRFLLPS